ncbi:sulfurtransferase [Aureococcus anophagefferens]|nr:sulfurtransferase [Aureococcus anophagefferens]
MAPARRSASSAGRPNDDVENLRSRGFASVAADLSHVAALRAAGGFFEQIAPIKALAVAPRYLAATRGYVGARVVAVRREPAPDLGNAWPSSAPGFDGAAFRDDGTPAPDLGNAWPSSAPGFDGAAFRDELERYGADLAREAVRIVRECASRLGFDAPTRGCAATLTLNYYVCDGSAPAGEPLVAEHTDVGVLTLVASDGGGCAALELLGDGEWSRAPFREGAVLVHAADCLPELVPGARTARHRVVATGEPGTRLSAALFVDFPDDHVVGPGMTYKTWRLSRVRRAMATAKAGARGKASAPRPRAKAAARPRPNSSTSPRVESSFFCADEARVALRLAALAAERTSAPPLRALTAEQVERFKVDGFLVVPNVLDASGLAAARRSRPAREAASAATRGLWAHVDRIGCRIPEAGEAGETGADGKQKAGKKKRIQRSLTPHLDCCPDALHAGGGKAFPRWRPIQCLLALDAAERADEGGFECAPGFHAAFADYYADRRARASKGLPCVGDYVALSPGDDAAAMRRVAHVPVPAGAALFWDQRVPHGNARSNRKAEPRAVVYGGFLPRGVPINDAYAAEQRRRLRVGAPQPDFWIHGPSSATSCRTTTARGLGPRARLWAKFTADAAGRPAGAWEKGDAAAGARAAFDLA